MTNHKIPVISWLAKLMHIGDKEGKTSPIEAVGVSVISLLVIMAFVGMTGMGYKYIAGVPVLGSGANDISNYFSGASLAGSADKQTGSELSGSGVTSQTSGLGGKISVAPGATTNTVHIAGINGANTSSAEYLAFTAYIYDTSDRLIGTGGVTIANTGASTTTLGIPGVYRMRIVGSSTTNSRVTPISGKAAAGFILTADAGTPNARLVTNGNDQYIEFETSGSNTYLSVYLTKNGGGLNIQEQTMSGVSVYNTSATTATDNWISVPAGGEANFTSTANNVTGTTVGSGGLFERQYWLETTATDEEFNDFGVLYLVDGGTSATTIWNDPTVTFSGYQTGSVVKSTTALSNIQGSLSSYERSKYSAYEWAYLIPADYSIRNPLYSTLSRSMSAKSGQNPAVADSPVALIVTRGNYLSIVPGYTVLTGAIKDNSALTVVYNTYTIRDVVV